MRDEGQKKENEGEKWMGRISKGGSGEVGDRENLTILLIHITPELGQVSCRRTVEERSGFSPTYPHGGTLTALGDKPVY